MEKDLVHLGHIGLTNAGSAHIHSVGACTKIGNSDPKEWLEAAAV